MKTKTTTNNSTKKFTYLRIPLDDKLGSGLQSIINDNPYFSQIDAAKFAIGRYIKQSYSSQNSIAKISINRLKQNNPNTNNDDVTTFLQNNPDTKIEFDTLEQIDQLFPTNLL
jgi:hypothetical protein